MTERTARQAVARYRKGESLKVVAGRFGVDPSTLAREFRRAGVPIRPGADGHRQDDNHDNRQLTLRPVPFGEPAPLAPDA